jgi:16S rRNA (guanine527-N7)-methyltransferase
MTTLALALAEGLQALPLELSQTQEKALLDYIELLGKWNKVYNLTAVREPEHMLKQHVLDCLAALPSLKQGFPEALDLLDVGAGGGLPSVVFAIACPHWQVTAVDAVPNLRAVHSRVETLSGGFDVVTCRAYASLRDFCDSSRHLLKPGGAWMAMKAKLSTEELADLPATVSVDKVEVLAVPGLDVDRCLVWMRPV